MFIPHFFYVDVPESGTNSDLLYCFPNSGREDNKLISLRGMFLTLSNVMLDVSKHPAKMLVL